MTLNISVPTTTQELRPKITVVGVGGAGGNAVNNMISANLEGVDFLVANTDGQALAASLAPRKLQLGRQQTEGLGAGSEPEIGRIAAQESLDDILAELTDSHMVFITAGMGGGTGTGAAPVIAKAARERGILTVGVVTKPFDFEGAVRMRQANKGIEELQAYVDTLIIIPNQNLFRLANERTTLADAFAMADDVLHKGVSGVTDLMIKPGNINLDFADIRSVMSEMGKAMMGTGEASGENRAANAAEAAINNPLLEDTTMKGAQAVLINITGGPDMTLFEVDEAANHIRREVDHDATIIFGSAIDDRMEGIMRVSVVATGMEAEANSQRPPLKPMMAAPMAKPITPPAVASASENFAEPATPAMAFSVQSSTAEDHHACTSPVMETASDDLNVPSFSLTNEADSETNDQADESASEDSIIAKHLDYPDGQDADDDQHDLIDMVADAEEEAAKAEEVEKPTEASAPKTDAPEPFTLRQIADIPEASAAYEEQKPISLIGHLTGMFGGKKAKAEKTKQDAPKITPVAMATVSKPTEDVSKPAHKDKVSVMTSPLSTPIEAEKDIEPAATSEEVDSKTVTEDAPASGLAALKPTPQPKLNIDDQNGDADLDIPAFLRRQAN
jgi:cell division protein FtsZ